MASKKPAAWLSELSLRERMLVHLQSAQSRFESAMVARFRGDWSEKEIRAALRELQHEQLIDLDALDRVRWRLNVAGMNAARRVRERALRAVAA